MIARPVVRPADRARCRRSLPGPFFTPPTTMGQLQACKAPLQRPGAKKGPLRGRLASRSAPNCRNRHTKDPGLYLGLAELLEAPGMCSIWRLAAISDFEGQVANLWIPVVWCFGGKPQEQQQQQEHENGGRPLAIYSELTEWCASRQRAGFARSSRLQAMSSCVRLRNPDCSAGRNLSIRIINHEKRGSDGLGGLEGAKRQFHPIYLPICQEGGWNSKPKILCACFSQPSGPPHLENTGVTVERGEREETQETARLGGLHFPTVI